MEKSEKNKKLNIVIGAIIVFLFAFFSFSGVSFFEKLGRPLYDTGIKFLQPKTQGVENIVLVEIDDKSLAELGPWPWPRHLIADMIVMLNEKGPKLVGLNIPYAEKELNEALKEIKAFHEKYNAYPPANRDKSLKRWVHNNFVQIEKRLDNDQALVESVRENKNVIMPVSETSVARKRTAKPHDISLLSQNFLKSTKISPVLRKRISIDRLSIPFDELLKNTVGLGHNILSSRNDMTGRSHPAYISYKGSLLPSFPLRLAIAYYDQRPGQVLAEENLIKLKGRTLPLTDGKMLIRFRGNEKKFPRFSFSDLLSKKKLPSNLKGKIVLIGFNHTGGRQFDTPNSSRMSESEFAAHILENIVNFSSIARPHFMTYLEILILLILGIAASIFFPRKGQVTKLVGTACIVILALLAGVVLLPVVGIWFKPIYIACCLVVIYLYLSARDLFLSEAFAKESHETSRLLGLSFQSQGMLDLAFDKFKKLPLNNETKDLIYNLGFEYEKKRMVNKALSAYEFINKERGFRDLDDRIPKLKASDKSSTLGSYGAAKEASIVSDSEITDRTTVGRYEIISELGRGSMGLVYKAQDPKINRLVAIKTIRFSDEFDEDVIQEIKERFFREAEIAGQLSHPSIVTIHDVGEDRDLTYMAMEFLEGEDLDKYIKKENLLPFRRVLDIIAKIADALDFAHKADVIHRDIKPANVMLLKNGQVKVTDFGIAKAISSSRTKTGVILGTPNYMSPEQIMGQKIDSKSDIFSLGVLFYQLITGELPFHGENLSGLLYQITQVKHPSPRSYNPKIPKVCEQIIDKAMFKGPNERFKVAGDMARVINSLGLKIDELKRKKAMNN